MYETCSEVLAELVFFVYLHSQMGRCAFSRAPICRNMVRWMSGLVTGLQNRLQRFESASDLTKTALETVLTLFFFCFVRHLYGNGHIDVISQINVTILSLIVSPNS